MCGHVWRSKADNFYDLLFSLYYVGPKDQGSQCPCLFRHLSSPNIPDSVLAQKLQTITEYKFMACSSLQQKKVKLCPSEEGWVIWSQKGEPCHGDVPPSWCVWEKAVEWLPAKQEVAPPHFCPSRNSNEWETQQMNSSSEWLKLLAAEM